MAGAIKELREVAGYVSGREYAEHLGIPFATYARYERDPRKIPLQQAWLIADDLGCSIDAVVGRTAAPIDERRSGVQQTYDALSPENQKLVDEFLAFVADRGLKADEAAKLRERRFYDGVCVQFENLFTKETSQDAQLRSSLIFGYFEQARSMFKAFAAKQLREMSEAQLVTIFNNEQCEDYVRLTIRDRSQTDAELASEFWGRRDAAREKLERECAEKLAGIMAAYDRAHPETALKREG